jgi:hypothetical protein
MTTSAFLRPACDLISPQHLQNATLVTSGDVAAPVSPIALRLLKPRRQEKRERARQ